MAWDEFQRLRPDLAEAGRRLLYQFGIGLAFLATVRRDGGPRLHPMCPLLTGDTLVGFLHPSPKRQDLHRDGRYALHCFPADDNEDAFMVSGRAVVVPTPPAARRPQRLEPPPHHLAGHLTLGRSPASGEDSPGRLAGYWPGSIRRIATRR